MTDLTQTTFQRSGGPTQYSYQPLKNKAWVKWLNTEICIQRNHTRAGQNYREERLNKNMMFKTPPAVRLKRLFEEKVRMERKVMKTVISCYAMGSWRSLCVCKAGFGWDFWRVMPQTNTHRKRAHLSGLQHRCMRLFMRDQLKHAHVWSHSTHTHTFTLRLCLWEIRHPTTSHLNNWGKTKELITLNIQFLNKCTLMQL